MLNNLLNTLAFGSTIQSNGKPYTVILRLTDRLFVVMEQNAELPCPLMLAQVDIQMGPGQQPGGQQIPPGPGPGGGDSPPGGGDPPTQPPGGDKKETVH